MNWTNYDPHIIYRLYDTEGVLLYVGITRGRPRDRINMHRHKEWGSQIASHTEESIQGRAAALRREAQAICDERPLHNIYQTERSPVRGKRSSYGRCPACGSLRPLRSDGHLKQHWSVQQLCSGSGMSPERFANGAGKDQEPFCPSRTRAEQGAGSREHGTREHGSSFTSVDLKTNPAVTRDARFGLGES